MTARPGLPTQKDLKKVFRAALDGGWDQVRLEVAGMVITATKDNAEAVAKSPLDHWRRYNG